VSRTSRIVTVLHRHKKKVWALGTPSSALIGLTQTTGMGADAFTWADGRPLNVDSHGNLFGLIEDGSNNHWWMYKNGASAWTIANHSWPSLTRGTVAYDATNNLAHVLWSTTQANGGIVYRRYVLTYSGQNITDINEDTGATIASVVQARTNVVLDDGSGIASYEHPGMIFLNDAAFGSLGGLLAFWGCQNASGNEVRAAMLNFNGVGAAGQTLSNWVAPVTSSTTTLGANTAPATGSYTAIFASANIGLPYVAGQRKANGTNAKDVYFWYDNGAAAHQYQYRRARWNSGSSNWSTGLTTAATVTNVVRAGTNFATGYNTNRTQLITRPTESVSGDCVFMAGMTWKDDANGDTWTLYKIDSADAITTTDVFSFGGSTNTTSGPWGDAAFDNAKGQLIVTYNNTSNFPQMQTRNTAMAVVNASVQLWSVVNGFDIACMVEGGSTNGTIWVVNRDTAVAHNGYAIATSWV
jgi:hypothetical protein